MREKKLYLIITFHTTAAAIAMERLCRDKGLPGRLIPLRSDDLTKVQKLKTAHIIGFFDNVCGFIMRYHLLFPLRTHILLSANFNKCQVCIEK